MDALTYTFYDWITVAPPSLFLLQLHYNSKMLKTDSPNASRGSSLPRTLSKESKLYGMRDIPTPPASGPGKTNTLLSPPPPPLPSGTHSLPISSSAYAQPRLCHWSMAHSSELHCSAWLSRIRVHSCLCRVCCGSVCLLLMCLGWFKLLLLVVFIILATVSVCPLLLFASSFWHRLKF